MGDVSHLAGRQVDLSEIYATNLCNEFLDHQPGSGTVLIPEDKAQKGIEEIAKTVESGHFKVILPMAVQPFYNLCKFGFVDERNELVRAFLTKRSSQADKG